MALIVGYPIGKLIWNSFFDLRLSGGGEAKFVGLDNHAPVLKDADVWNAASNSGLLTLITVPAALTLGMGRRGWPTFRSSASGRSARPRLLAAAIIFVNGCFPRDADTSGVLRRCLMSTRFSTWIHDEDYSHQGF